MSTGHDERMRRWRLVLGAADGTGVSLTGDDARIVVGMDEHQLLGVGDASAPLEFAFHPRDDDPQTTLFCLKTII